MAGRTLAPLVASSAARTRHRAVGATGGRGPERGNPKRRARPPAEGLLSPPCARRAAMVLRCANCPLWYGAENDEYGPCQVKHARTETRFVTFGTHACDEGFTEESWR